MLSFFPPKYLFWSQRNEARNQQQKKNWKIHSYVDIKPEAGGFPGGPVMESLSCNVGNVGSIPGWGTKTPHAEEQLRPACHSWRAHRDPRWHEDASRCSQDVTEPERQPTSQRADVHSTQRGHRVLGLPWADTRETPWVPQHTSSKCRVYKHVNSVAKQEEWP